MLFLIFIYCGKGLLCLGNCYVYYLLCLVFVMKLCFVFVCLGLVMKSPSPIFLKNNKDPCAPDTSHIDKYLYEATFDLTGKT